MTTETMEMLDGNTQEVLPVIAEAADSAELVPLDESELDDCSGGFGGGSSTSGFSRLRQSFGSMNFAGPDGAGSMRFGEMEDVSSFVQDIFE